MDWQPIETAPTDQPILVWHESGITGVAVFSRHWGYAGDEPFLSSSHAWVGDAGGGRNGVWMGGDDATKAKLWMPLPEAPQP